MTHKEFCETYITLSESLYRVAFYILESREDAEDALQDLFLRLWQSRDTLSAVHNPKAYGITLMRNICIDRVRKGRGNGAVVSLESFNGEETGSSSLSREDAESCLEISEKTDRVLSLIGTLPKGEREVMKLRVLEELSYDEISKRTGMNPLTLRVLLSRARKKIRKAAI